MLSSQRSAEPAAAAAMTPPRQHFEAQHVHEIHVYGYTVVRDVLSVPQCQQLRETLLQCRELFGEGHTHRTPNAPGQVGAWHVANLPTMARCFHALIDHPRIVPLVEHFMGPDIILGSLSSRIVRPGDPEQGLHGDIGQSMVDDTDDRHFPKMMNTVWMLQETGPFNGGTRIVPGSHVSGMSELPEGFEPPLVVQPDCPPGSVIVYNGHAWHAGGSNTSDTYRCSCFGHYRKSMEEFPRFGGRIFQCDPSAGFPPSWWHQLSPRQKQLMGMADGVQGPPPGEAYDGDSAYPDRAPHAAPVQLSICSPCEHTPTAS